MIRKMIERLIGLALDRLDDGSLYGDGYSDGLAAGRAEERARVRWLEGCEAMDLLLHIGNPLRTRTVDRRRS